MDLHKEVRFEEEICAWLGARGWVYETGVSAQYDRRLALFPEDVIGWVQETQPEAWAALAKAFGIQAGPLLLKRLREQMDTRGALAVLRGGLEMHPVRGELKLAQFRPASGMNPAITARYAANRLRVLRQVRFSEAKEDSLDLVLFLNGIPVATAELKSDFTQRVGDAVDQYRLDRDPKPKGQPHPEPLLSFPGGALVHFAVSNSEAQMTTLLAGKATRFLPFNRGNNGAAGNAPSASGHPTSYLWEEVWQRESWLDILGRYLVLERDEKKQAKRYLFPRYHQLAATRKLLEAVTAEGAGGKYLIQHSAGSGKTNSIAWTAHFLSELHDAEHRKVFDSVLVVSDRKVIDGQLQEAVYALERTRGVVTTIKSEGGSKSGQLAEALNGDKKIVVCTIQTFPFALEKVRELAATEGKRFAVIADEAHSSQTGETAAKLKQVLTAEEWKEIEAAGGEVSTEDVLTARMSGRTKADAGITFVAFTATPKSKTMELFGRRPKPEEVAGPGNLPEAFHVYSMRQAIEEEFILDVLKNFTTYKLAFRLSHEGKELDDTEVERSAAVKGIMRWVRLHPYNVSQKVEIVVEHFLENVQPLLRGHAKAMVVTGSRLEAVRWQLAMQRYIQRRGYDLRALVAFSGEVPDAETGMEPLTETSGLLNPTLRGRDIRDAFAGDEFQILLVANKFQTGFDQPLLCGMYVDRRLDGIQAVQTLSRLNRAYSGPYGLKDTTYVLDFVTEGVEILAAFKTYYETATLEDVTDPNLVYDMRAKLDATGYYDEPEVDRVAAVELDPVSKPSDLERAIYPVADRLTKQYKAAHQRWLTARAVRDDQSAEAARGEKEALLLFRRDLSSFGHAYTFLSQIFEYGNSGLEKRSIFYKRLERSLEFEREREGVDLSQVVLTHHALRNAGTQALPLGDGDSQLLRPLTEAGSGAVQDKEKAFLAEILAGVNDLFGADTTETDRLVYVNNVLKGKLLESEELIRQAANNTKQQFANSPDLDVSILNAIMDARGANQSMTQQALASEHVRAGLKEILLGPGNLHDLLRVKAEFQPIS